MISQAEKPGIAVHAISKDYDSGLVRLVATPSRARRSDDGGVGRYLGTQMGGPSSKYDVFNGLVGL